MNNLFTRLFRKQDTKLNDFGYPIPIHNPEITMAPQPGCSGGQFQKQFWYNTDEELIKEADRIRFKQNDRRIEWMGLNVYPVDYLKFPITT